MWIFLLVILSLSYLHQVLDLSLYGKLRQILCFCLLSAAVGLALFPMAVRLNFQSLAALLNNADGLSLA
ncbi:MAG: hypothetical protein JXR89_08700, partial [Deltaproteobacteria bacterium]|nr:hypothetical protein [Deltaproteobacteria bacterium]